jgi:hypothetical protein
MSNELTVRTRGVQLQSIDDVSRVSRMFADSGLFNDAREAAQCGVKIMAGAAWGIDPFTAMVGIHIIQNKPTVSAGLMAAAIKGHPKYDYRVRERSDKVCRIEFFEGTESLGVNEYTIEMAQRAGLLNNPTWKKFPEAMLFARAISSGMRTFCPDVFQATVYTPEELGANVDGDGEIIDVPSRPERPTAPALSAPAPEPTPEPAAAPEASGEPVEAAPVDGGGVTVKQLSALAIAVKKQGLTPEQSRAFLSWVLDRPISSAKDLTKAEASRVIGWDDSQFSEALSDYAVALEGGPPEDEPDWSDLPASEDQPIAFDPSGKADRKPRKAVGA